MVTKRRVADAAPSSERLRDRAGRAPDPPRSHAHRSPPAFRPGSGCCGLRPPGPPALRPPLGFGQRGPQEKAGMGGRRGQLPCPLGSPCGNAAGPQPVPLPEATAPSGGRPLPAASGLSGSQGPLSPGPFAPRGTSGPTAAGPGALRRPRLLPRLIPPSSCPRLRTPALRGSLAHAPEDPPDPACRAAPRPGSGGAGAPRSRSLEPFWFFHIRTARPAPGEQATQRRGL